MNKSVGSFDFANLLLSWFNKQKRQLPFRKNKNPYRVWLSEIILQQTQMIRGVDYYERFIKKFPDVVSLSAASTEEVYSLWRGLGYYNRAKNLHETAKIISKSGGVFPKKEKELLLLPGVGPYTAAAISSICFNEKSYVIDANVVRVLSRVFGLNYNISKQKSIKRFLKLTLTLTVNVKQHGDYNEAIMDFGGVVCLPKKPMCEGCFLKTNCFAFNKGLTEKFPVKKKNPTRKKRLFNYFVFINNENILLKKRTSKDIWLNLYEFYMIEGVQNKIARDKLTKNIKLTRSVNRGVVLHSTLSHQFIKSVFTQINIKEESEFERIKDKLNMISVPKNKIYSLGVPKVIDNYLKSHT